MNDFWEDTALRLLEMNLNGHSLNANTVKDLFAEHPEILDELDISNGTEKVENLDRALYGGRPQIIEIREAKPLKFITVKLVTDLSNVVIISVAIYNPNCTKNDIELWN